jgi:hypothetical protein
VGSLVEKAKRPIAHEGVEGTEQLHSGTFCFPAQDDIRCLQDNHTLLNTDRLKQSNHALYRDDNAYVYYKLEEAKRTTAYAASIKPFQHTKNECGAFQVLTNQYAGQEQDDIQDDIRINAVLCRISRIPASDRAHMSRLPFGRYPTSLF